MTATVEPPGIVSQTVVVHNGCASPNRVKMIIAYGDDGDCLQYAPGQSIRNSFWVRTAGVTGATRFDGLEAC